MNNYSTLSNNVYDNATPFAEQKFIDATNIPQFLFIPSNVNIYNSNNKTENDRNSDYTSLHSSTVEFVNRFRFVNCFKFYNYKNLI